MVCARNNGLLGATQLAELKKKMSRGQVQVGKSLLIDVG